jgi:hypothetical protein
MPQCHRECDPRGIKKKLVKPATSDVPKRKHWGFFRWLGGRPGLVFLLVLIALLAPIIAGLLATRIAKSEGGVILAALVGTWPDLNPTTMTNKADDLGPWIGVGVGCSAFAVFGIPTILGLVITYHTEKIERRVAMSLNSYLADRDRFIAGYVYRDFQAKFGLPDAACRAAAHAAIQQASDEWTRSSEQTILDFLNNTEIPGPGRA